VFGDVEAITDPLDALRFVLQAVGDAVEVVGDRQRCPVPSEGIEDPIPGIGVLGEEALDQDGRGPDLVEVALGEVGLVAELQ
jgi:hypothetical protein